MCLAAKLKASVSKLKLQWLIANARVESESSRVGLREEVKPGMDPNIRK